MTECERIIKKGVIPESFLNQEIRNDFSVTNERKKIWMIQLDILFEIIRICEKHNIDYFLAGGCILGAVRHKGFIPWDDDIDVSMFRDDYEKFCKICASELKDPYFLKSTETENNCWYNGAKVCNSNTTAIRKPEVGKSGINKGIFVDIIPMDYVADNPITRKIIFSRVKLRTILANAYSFNVNKSLAAQIASRILRSKIVDFNVKKWCVKTNKIASSPSKYSKKIGFVVCTPYKHDRVTWDIDDFNGYVDLPFEFTSIRVPSGYKNILTVMYHDYMKFPPVEERGKWHNIIFDPDTPYEDYCKAHNM